MIRYRLVVVLATVLASLLYLSAWRAADMALGVRDAGAGLAVPLDDAAIYFQYAQQALRGEWLSYSPGAELSTGVTSPLYFMLLTGLMGLGIGGPWAVWMLGAACLMLGVAAMDALARRHFPALPPWWAPLLLLSHGAWIGWHFNGMETGLLLSLSLCAMLAAGGRRRGPFLAVLAALAFTRPEGQVLAALLGLAWALDRDEPAAGWIALLLAALPSGGLWLLSGGLVPDSLRPKAAALQQGQSIWDLAARTSEYAVGLLKGAWLGLWSGQDRVGLAGDGASNNPVAPLFAPLLLLASLLGFFSPGRRGERHFRLAVAAALAGIGGLLSWQLPVGWHSHRYLAAGAPLLWLGALAALQALRHRGGLGRPASAALLTLWTAFGLASWPWHLQRAYSGAKAYALANRNTALALRELPPGGVAVADAGLLAYYSQRPVADLLGITDHALALAQAHGKGAVLEALLARNPPPRWAALHQDRPDMDLSGWLALGLLRPLAHPPATPGEGMALFTWDWHDARQQGRPAGLPVGWQVQGALNVALLAHEHAAAYRARGPHASRSRALNLRVPGGAQVPEGGRQVLEETFDRVGEALVLRAAFDRPGRVRVRAEDGRNLLFAAIAASPSEYYSELWLPLPPAGPDRVTVAFEDEKGQPSAWTSCHYWFVDRTGP